MMKRMNFLALLLATIFTFAISSTASALPLIRLTAFPSSGGSFTTTIFDEGADDLFKPLPGNVGFGGFFAGFDVSLFSSGTSKPITGSTSLPVMHMSFSVTTSSTGGTLIAEFLDHDFTSPLSTSGLTMFSGGSSAGGSASVVYETFYSASNVTDPDDPSFTSLNTITGFGSSVISTPTPSPLTVPGSYSLMQIITLTHGSGGVSSSLDATLVTPEPATVVLLGLGLLGMGVYSRKRRKS